MQTEDKKKYSLPLKAKKSVSVRESPRGYERNLQLLWNTLPENTIIELENGRKAVILFPGIRNLEKGPDYRNAKIRFGSKVMEGDVDIHCRVSDFIRHGHVSDPDYANVILHCAKINDLKSIPPRQMEKLPVFLYDEAKIQSILAAQKKAVPEEKKKTVEPEKKAEEKKIPAVYCPALAALSPEEQKTFFQEAAKERLFLKAEPILKNMIAQGAANAFTEQLFLFAGYPGNMDNFRSLFTTFIHYPQEIREKDFHTILWGESGLLPDPSSEDLSEEGSLFAKEYWEKFSLICTGSKRKNIWKRTGTVFGNTPERRLAMLCSLMEKFSHLPLKDLAEKLKKDDGRTFRKKLDDFLTVSDPFWEYFTSFSARSNPRKRTLFSDSKKLTFYSDCLIPSLLAYGKLKKDPLLLQKTEDFFLLLPAPDTNSVVKKASHLWYNALLQPSTSAQMQGWMHIYKKYCDPLSHDCSNCILAEE